MVEQHCLKCSGTSLHSASVVRSGGRWPVLEYASFIAFFVIGPGLKPSLSSAQVSQETSSHVFQACWSDVHADRKSLLISHGLWLRSRSICFLLFMCTSVVQFVFLVVSPELVMALVCAA